MKKLSAFETAFAAARAAKKKTFKHAGKSYTTDMATPKTAPIPTSAPRNPSKPATGNTIPTKAAPVVAKKITPKNPISTSISKGETSVDRAAKKTKPGPGDGTRPILKVLGAKK